MSQFDTQLFTLLQNIKTQMKLQPLVLGGVSTSGGGGGGPPGGFIGVLPQTRVSYDTTEASSSGIVGSGTLVDNLNHIRAKLDELESRIEVLEAIVL